MNAMDDIWSEHRFWLRNLGDHARFLFHAFSPNETGELRNLKTFILSFDSLSGRIERPAPDRADFCQKARRQAKLFLDYQLALLALTLSGKAGLSVSSARIGHMLNETEEYLSLTESLGEGRIPLYYPLHYHLLWLPCLSGHAACVASRLDPAERGTLETYLEYERLFFNLYAAALEYNGFMRTKLASFPALERLHLQAETLASSFRASLEELLSLCGNGGLLGFLTPPLAEHMAREAAYFQKKLSQAAGNMRDTG